MAKRRNFCMINDFRLDGCTVCITGATGHLGSSLVRGCADAGAKVVITARNTQRLAKFCSTLKAEAIDVEAIACDISDPHQRELFANKLLSRIDRLDVLINNAHGGRAGCWSQSDEEDFTLAQSLAVTAPHDFIKRLLPILQKGANCRYGGASIVNISSMYGSVSPDPAIYGDSGLNSPPQYGAAKAGMIQLTRYLAVHLASSNIRVNAITPGPFPTKKIQEEMPKFCERLAQKVPLKRLGNPQELVGPALFLASDASSFVSGISLPVDGGWTAW